jgi:AmiR/NasT family two-component response regulator
MELKVLIVEDEVLLAMELESELKDAGHQVIGHAMSSTDATSIMARSRPDFAFVDIHLQDGPTGIGVGSQLAAIGVPYVFMSGNVKRIPDDFAGAWGAIEKPYSAAGFRNALDYLSRRLAGGGDEYNVPPGLKVPDEENA